MYLKKLCVDIYSHHCDWMLHITILYIYNRLNFYIYKHSVNVCYIGVLQGNFVDAMSL